MLKIKIGKKEIEYLNAVETEEYYNGASRRTLSIECGKDEISLDELNEIVSDEKNTEEIVLTAVDENGEITAENVYGGYVLKLSCGINKILVQPETPENAAVYEDRIVVKLGKRTYIEEQLHKLGL